jgi:purine-binding chemotaxis protein CheW
MTDAAADATISKGAPAQPMGRSTKAFDKEGKYLTFELAGEPYGLGILNVREIIGMMDITSVPQTPVFVKGLINLRGKVIPVIDLRLKFGLAEMDYTDRTAIIVVEVPLPSGPVQMGIVVDTVSEVVHFTSVDIEAAPTFGAQVKTDYILGMAKARSKVVILLDIGQVLTDEELTLVG